MTGTHQHIQARGAAAKYDFKRKTFQYSAQRLMRHYEDEEIVDGAGVCREGFLQGFI